MSLNAARKAVHLHSVDEFNKLHEASSTIKSPAQILFLNGHPSPQWLNAIGGKYRVDPEFYQRHLDFRAAVSRPDYFTLPALPSASEKMVKLRITTIGYRQPRLRLSGYRHLQKHLDGLRADAAKGMADYENTLKMEDKWETGDSIIRDFAIIDAEHCIIEQDISVCIDRVGHGWMGNFSCPLEKAETDGISSISLARYRSHSRNQPPWSVDKLEKTEGRPNRSPSNNTTQVQNRP